MPGYIIAEQHGIYPLFSGHNTICVVTALLETGQLHMVEPLTEFKLEAPGGLISIEAECEVSYIIVSSISLCTPVYREALPRRRWTQKRTYREGVSNHTGHYHGVGLLF